MDREQLKEILPHRDPMLLLDSSEVIDGIACGTYKVRGDEFFLQGHFPGNPVVPGVILCEMMAQNCCVLVGAEATQGKDTFYTSMDKIRFKHPVVPGDEVSIRCELTRHKGPFYFASGKVFVGEDLCVSGEFSIALMPKKA